MTIDLFNKSAYDGNKPLIINGKYVNRKPRQSAVTIDELESLYKDYKYSIPDSIHYKFNYFKALSYDVLSIDNLINGKNRQKCKAALEMALLEGILNKSLVWQDDSKYFWQSENDKDFVLLRAWF